ncbi:MAG TPA: 4'-phosphopantetheinyl transferase superfamily protein, partial [Ktedonobacteraceae bacterium]|nr:4'-phosphopantetheinyl transferase superfamily protein [Ktedonobacteraceae bacterium]
PPHPLILQSGEVHAWRAALEQPDAVCARLQATLAPDELAKAVRFHFARDRQHYIIARGILRTLLYGYTKVHPLSMRFAYNAYGKPSLDMAGVEQDIRFNLAHSRDLALYAFTLSHEVGIDVEYMKTDIDAEQVARHSFSPEEQAALRALPPGERLQGFYNGWTRKEAYIKARGMGVSLALDSFDVALKPGDPAALLRSREDAREPMRWKLMELEPGEGYAGALAVEGQHWRLHYFQWHGD